MNILIVGVGGQGSLLASKIIGAAALAAGHDVKVSEVHGMSQRGGSVVTYVRWGDRVCSPVRGDADVILSFEQLEAARWLPLLKPGGVIVTSDQRINPMPVITGAAEYPSDLADKLREAGARVISGDALSIARSAGNEKASNVALIGMAAGVIGLDPGTLRGAVAECVPAKFREVNLAAFDAGRLCG